jgi:hypothetical protein
MASVCHSVCPAICIECGCTAQMEPDQRAGYCGRTARTWFFRVSTSQSITIGVGYEQHHGYEQRDLRRPRGSHITDHPRGVCSLQAAKALRGRANFKGSNEASPGSRTTRNGQSTQL